MVLAVLLPLAWLCLAIPSLWDWLFGTWTAYSQGHELLLLSVAAWLMWRQRRALGCDAPARLGPLFWLGWGLGIGVGAYLLAAAEMARYLDLGGTK